MFSGVFFFTYIFAGFVGFLAILIVILLAKYWTSGNKKLLASIKNFMICTAMIDALYFYIDYRVLTVGHHSASSVLRILDIILFIGQIYFWSAYIREKSHVKLSAGKTKTTLLYAAFILCLIAALISYGFLMNDYYITAPGAKRIIAISLEILICIFLTSVNIWHLIKGRSNVLQKKIRISLTLISTFITINGVWNAILVIGLMTQIADPELSKTADPTALFIFIINLFTVFLVYQEDFSALFNITEKQPEIDHTKARLDLIAQSHNLTQREREVLELAYEGLTNPEIADELIISKYTVKRHMHNIFEKLDISTRVELIHFVNQENGPNGPL